MGPSTSWPFCGHSEFHCHVVYHGEMSDPNPYRPSGSPTEESTKRQLPPAISGRLVVLVILVVVFLIGPVNAIVEFIGYLREQ